MLRARINRFRSIAIATGGGVHVKAIHPNSLIARPVESKKAI